MLIKEGFLKLHQAIKKKVMYIVALSKSISIIKIMKYLLITSLLIEPHIH
jgi:hypothetical protein